VIACALQPRTLFAVLLAAAVAILGTALASQYLGGLAPCELCLWQRYPYAIVIGLAGIGFGLAGVHGMPRGALAGVAALIALALAADAAIAVFHVGVEQHWWQGAAGCTGETGGARTAADLARQLKVTPVVRCDEVAWSLLGVSMAGYNALAAAALAAYAAAGAWAIRPNAKESGR
jgi:disulfide bond formation protein DsbB